MLKIANSGTKFNFNDIGQSASIWTILQTFFFLAGHENRHMDQDPVK